MHAWLLTKKLYDVTSGNDKLIHVPVPSFAKLATSVTDFYIANSQIHQ
jgi:hypothetical protein